MPFWMSQRRDIELDIAPAYLLSDETMREAR